MNNKELLKLIGKALGAGLIVGVLTYELVNVVFIKRYINTLHQSFLEMLDKFKER